MSQSLLKSIKLLDCFKGRGELTLQELVKLSNLPKTTVFRLVSSLEKGGLLVSRREFNRAVKYKLGLKLLELGNSVLQQLEYRKVAFPYMEQLNKELNEFVHLTVIEGNEAVYVEKIASNKSVRLVIETGKRAPLYAGSASKLLLAYMDSDSLEAYLKNLTIIKVGDNTIEDKETLREELEKIRKNGYSRSHAEHFKDTMGFSCPIRDNTGQVIAALGVNIPITDYSEDREPIILEKVREMSVKISAELGYKG
ncbi:IclR family transcriptional regulator [Oceanobacillus rekensis]|uniref:IclR family transcriptional regulator n=1 Tax=Oceanobacillus rekensis TaxID=937927 RepID=UPI001122E0FA|nr:IclR family transcriptional regulator [Oceanobacillus rekensis]